MTRRLRTVPPVTTPAPKGERPSLGCHVDHVKLGHGVVVGTSANGLHPSVVVRFRSGRLFDLLVEYARLDVVECACDPREWPESEPPRPLDRHDVSDLFGPEAS